MEKETKTYPTIMPSEILLPEGIDLTKWACVACDQHTKEKEYFAALEKLVGDNKSAYRIIFPEAFLGENDDERIKKINAEMEMYIEEGVFKAYDGYVLTIRTDSNGLRRAGVLVSINLDDYSFEKISTLPIRATEGTVTERIPARVKIRRNAPLELPHVMLLVDDEERSVIEVLEKRKSEFEKIYDFELNMGGGHVEGYYIPKVIDVAAELQKTQKNGLLFAVGDGNHSLAAAKTVWENKKPTADKDDPCRYALVEIVNVYSDALEFKPIHRLVQNVDEKDFEKYLSSRLVGDGELKIFSGKSEKKSKCPKDAVLCYKAVQEAIDEYIKEKGGEVDYIHGDDVLKKLSQEKNSVGIMMPTLEKKEFFPSIEKFGALPRKTFSMGEADDKRYYLEARKIRK